MELHPQKARKLSVLIIGKPLAINAPCRVVYTVDEPGRRGFAYGTLPGHPEAGEESCILEVHDDSRITFTVSAFSRPDSPLARAAGPVGRYLQHWMTSRYLNAMDSLVAR